MIRLLVVAIMLAALPASAQEDENRFVAYPDHSDSGGIWILDTKTGAVRYCIGLSGPDWKMSVECSESKS